MHIHKYHSTVNRASLYFCARILFFSLVVFLLLFNPPILKFNTIHIITILSFGYLLIHRADLKANFRQRRLVSVIASLCLLGCYQLIIGLVMSNSYNTALNYVFWILEVIPCSIAIALYYRKNGYDFEILLLTIGMASLFQSVLALGALVSPSIKSFFINKLIAYGYPEVHLRLSQFRNYGFADSLTFASSIVQAIIASICLFFYLNGGRKLFLLVFIMGASTSAINTRSAIVVIAAGLVIDLVITRNTKAVLKIIKVAFLLSVAVVVGLTTLRTLNDWTYDWVVSGVKEVFAFITRDSSNYGYFNYVSENHMPFPSVIESFFGMGIEVMHENKYGVQSDIGYINDIWRIGILMTLAIYVLFALLLSQIRHSKKAHPVHARYLSLFLLVSAMLINVKGYFFVYNDITTFIWIVYAFLCLQRNKPDDCTEGLASALRNHSLSEA